jgi:16S rRNA (cytidine1402-2'-O)-methyltransferase
MSVGKVFLLPMLLHEEGWDSIPADIVKWIQQCDAFFVENEKTTRRFFKKVWKEMIIDNYIWHPIHKVEEAQIQVFTQLLAQGKNIGIVSEAGCAGIADPGQILVHAAQEMGAIVKPYTAPSSLLLALMASGMNGQNFQFHGYLPIDNNERKKKIQTLEAEANSKLQKKFDMINLQLQNNNKSPAAVRSSQSKRASEDMDQTIDV